jgi:threonylcarbamoyladenosine tRNA methylthiotransferase MtaB
MKAFISNLGCKLNQAEVEQWARRLVVDGHQIVDRIEEAEVHLVNSCTVTHRAARDSRKVARRARRARRADGESSIVTVVAGCLASDPESGVTGEEADLVVPNSDKDQLVERLYEAYPQYRPAPRNEIAPVPVSFVRLPFGRARAALKIEDGCNMRCAFCIIPTTRGRQRSRSAAELVEELGALEASSYREVVITGVQISAYRDGECDLYELCRLLLAHTDILRLRLTSIAPWQFDQRLLELLCRPRVCRHVHFSLQSGCDATLRRMRRPYSTEQFASLLEGVRSRVPGIAVTSDVIVGFPGESDSELEQSLAFVRACSFAKTHVFTYSERAGTVAATLSGAVPESERKDRTARMRAIADAAERAFWASQEGTEGDVLWEGVRDGYWRGTTDNYVRILMPAGGNRVAEGSERRPDALRAGMITRERLVRDRRAFDAAATGPNGLRGLTVASAALGSGRNLAARRR